jgi:hypothetical protein
MQIENERLDLQYELLKVVYGGRHYFAPLQKPKKILDIGTGTGMWCLEMGECFLTSQNFFFSLPATSLFSLA